MFPDYDYHREPFSKYVPMEIRSTKEVMEYANPQDREAGCVRDEVR